VWLAGCDKNDELPVDTTSQEIVFDMLFADDDPSTTKVATATDFTGAWEENDEIGVYVVKGSGGLKASGNYADNVPFRYGNGRWTPIDPQYYPNDGETLSFYAYYPYDETISDATNITFSVKTNQNSLTSGTSNYNLSDLLTAQKTNVAKSENAVQLQFSHALSLVQVEVKRDVNVQPFTDDLTVTLTNALPDATLSWSSALIGAGTPANITMHKVTGMDYTYRTLVPAQTLGTSSKVTFTQTTTGKEIAMQYSGIASATLAAAAAKKYSVTLGYGIDPTHKYAVGDIYPHVGPAVGIVYWLDPASGGKHGKVMSLTHTWFFMWADINNLTFETETTDATNGFNNMKTMASLVNNGTKVWSNFPPFAEIHKQNNLAETYSESFATGVWYLPAIDEWTEFYNIFSSYGQSSFNTLLTSASGNSIGQFYWSSTENSANQAYLFDQFPATKEVLLNKNGGTFYVRGICRF
jgi:hypothetical protein